jgi:hypothetical protein
MGEILSQTKIFADFGATAGGSPGGAIWLQRISSMKVTDERSVEVVKAIGIEGGAGFRRKTGGGTLMLTENRQDKPQVDWRKLKRDKKIFMIMAQDENNGQREKFFSCTVSKIDRSASDEGEHTDEIELKFLSSIAG